MPMRLGPGPVFVYEWLTSARRWQLYAMRAGFIGAILVGLCFVWSQGSNYRLPDAPVSLQRAGADRLADLPDDRLRRADADPAGGAGGDGRGRLPRQGAGYARPHARHRPLQCRDRAGQARSAADPRAGPGRLPRACGGDNLASWAGSTRWRWSARSCVAIGCAFIGCTLAMALSVHGRKIHEVLIMTYILIILWILAQGLLETASFVLTGAAPRTGLSTGRLRYGAGGRTPTSWSWCRMPTRAGPTW